MKRLLSALLLLVFNAAAHLPPADALPPLRRALARARADSTRGRLYWALGAVSDRSDSMVALSQRAVWLLERALPAARGAERQRLLGLLGGAVNNLGVGYSEGGDKTRPKAYYLRAARLRRQGGDVRGQVESLWNLANWHRKQADYAGALRYLHRGIRAGEGVPAARAKVARCFVSMGTLYGLLGDEAARLRYQLYALTMFEQNGEPLALLRSLNNVAYTYLNNHGDTARAEAYARRAQQLAANTPGAKKGLARSLELRGEIRLRQRRLAPARAFLLDAHQLAARSKSAVRLAGIRNALAQVEEAAGNVPRALHYARQAAAAQGSTLARQRDAEAILARLHERLGQPRTALTHFHRFVALSDSLRHEENKQAGYRQRLRHEFERREASLKAAQERRQAVARAEIRRQKQLRTLTSAGAGLLLLLAGGLYFAFRRSERLKQLVTKQKQNLQTQRDRLGRSLTKLRATQAQLIQSEKMASLGELTAGIAHEIQNPLNFVTNFAQVSAELCQEAQELLAADARPAAEQGKLTDLLADLERNHTKISEHGQRAAGIVRGMLEHARPSTGARAPTDLNGLCDEYLRLAYHGLRATDQSFTADLATNFAPALPRVNVVGPDVGRVLLNLFGNAFYAVRQRQRAGEAGYRPAVGVRTGVLGRQVHILVTDNGTGMSAAVAKKAFQPFFTTKPAGEGTGLGLSLSHDIIAQGHGGTLTVESVPGKGTTFRVGLPVNGPA